MVIRLANENDGAAMLDIYGPIIEQTATSFEFSIPSADQFNSRIHKILQTHPWLVCTDQESVIGYAYAGPHRSRVAYQWTVEMSVYIDRKFRQRGVARALYRALIVCLKQQGFYTALAGITLPNESSVEFHQSFGFTPVGTYNNVGYKFGRWHAVGWWEYVLRSYEESPEAPLPLDAVKSSMEVQKIMKSAAASITPNRNQ